MDLITDLELSALLLIKISVVIFLAIYVVFSLIVIKQVRVMTNTLQVGFEKQIIALAYLHLFAALIVFVLSIFIL